MLSAFTKALEEGCHHVVDKEHLEEHPCKPITEFGGSLHGTKKTLVEGVLGAQHDEHTKENECGKYLYLDFLPSERSKVLGCPKPFFLICQKAADEEE